MISDEWKRFLGAVVDANAVNVTLVSQAHDHVEELLEPSTKYLDLT
jgi:hypothetical protein